MQEVEILHFEHIIYSYIRERTYQDYVFRIVFPLYEGMTQMKVLEFIKESSLASIGGPIGYNYTLYIEDGKNGIRLNYLGNSLKKNNSKRSESFTNHNRRIWSIFKEKLYFSKILCIGKHNKGIESNEYDIIHFHTTLDLYKYRASLKKYKGITVLTSHSPTLLSIETFQNAKKWERIIFYPVYKAFRYVDYGAFKLADYIVFPCIYAEEPYEHAWKGFIRFKESNQQKFKYLLTGTTKRYAKKQREEICEECGIPKDAFIISYVGRHNKIKGYDRLKEIGEIVLREHKNVYILVCGAETPIQGLKNDRWIEVGWTDDPHSYIAASNLFILPNKETYFDLILLEVLSIGTPVLASRTGGNKYFDNDEYPGIKEFDTEEDAVEIIKYMMKLTSEQAQALRRDNVRQFEKKFSSEIFYNNYISLMQEICTKENKNGKTGKKY